jgi:hypothetical protein
MLTILFLSFLCGSLNAVRGSGVPHMKPVVLVFMGLCAYSISQLWLAGVLFPIPLALTWIWKGGTGRQMPHILSWFKPPFVPVNYRWRAWEFTHVFIYSLVVLCLLS